MVSIPSIYCKIEDGGSYCFNHITFYIHIVYCGTPSLQAGEFCPALGQKPLQLEVLEGGIDAG